MVINLEKKCPTVVNVISMFDGIKQNSGCMVCVLAFGIMVKIRRPYRGLGG
jgi:hypothetical protein